LFAVLAVLVIGDMNEDAVWHTARRRTRTDGAAIIFLIFVEIIIVFNLSDVLVLDPSVARGDVMVFW